VQRISLTVFHIPAFGSVATIHAVPDLYQSLLVADVNGCFGKPSQQYAF
jgi:hypothetical protein